MATAKAKALIFGDWLRERCVRGAGVSTLHAALYADHRRHAGEAALGPQAFARAMEGEGFRVLKLAGGQHRQGVRLRVSGSQVDEIAVTMAFPSGALGPTFAAAPSVSSLRDDPPPPPVAGKDGASALVWDLRSVPFVGGPAVVSIALECPDDEDEVSARIAGELYLARRGHRMPDASAAKDDPRRDGYSHADDDALAPGELASMAAALSYAASVPEGARGWMNARRDVEGLRPPGAYHFLGMVRALWLRSFETFKVATPRTWLVKAGGLVIAAIETIDRREARRVKEEERANG